VQVKPTAGSPFFEAFPSDRIPKTTKAMHVHFYIHGINSCKLYKRIPVNFEATTYMHHRLNRYILSACGFRSSVTSHRAFLKTCKRSGKYLLGIYQHQTLHFARQLLP